MVAETILKQLGGSGRLKAMIGAKSFGKGSDDKGREYLGIRFTARAKKSINYIKITLNGMDLYDIELGSIRANKYTVKEELSDIYAEDMKRVLEDKLGLYLSM